MTRYVDIRVTEKQFKLIYDFISREASHMDSGDFRLDNQVKVLAKKLNRIRNGL